MIRKFRKDDIKDAKDITFAIWSKEINDFSYKFKQMLYEYLVRYYLLNEEFSLVYDENGVKAFLLAAYKKDHNNADEWFSKQIASLPSEEQEMALEYKKYLSSNGSSLKSIMKDEDLYMALFASSVSGKGRYLLTHLESLCKERGVKNIYLWTDETCNYSYYDKNHFNKITEFPSTLKLGNKPLKTFIFKKALN